MNDATAVKEEPKVNTVTMTDGRIVEFVGKRKMLKSSGQNADGTLFVQIDFINGETRKYPIPAEDIPLYACHGAEQKYGDQVAGETDVDAMVASIDDLADRLVNRHEWNVKREAGDSFSGVGVIVKAMCKVTKKSVEDIKAYLEAKLAQANAGQEKPVLSRQALYKAIRGSEKFGPTIAEMEAAKASKGPEVTFGDL